MESPELVLGGGYERTAPGENLWKTPSRQATGGRMHSICAR